MGSEQQTIKSLEYKTTLLEIIICSGNCSQKFKMATFNLRDSVTAQCGYHAHKDIATIDEEFLSLGNDYIRRTRSVVYREKLISIL